MRHLANKEKITRFSISMEEALDLYEGYLECQSSLSDAFGKVQFV